MQSFQTVTNTPAPSRKNNMPYKRMMSGRNMKWAVTFLATAMVALPVGPFTPLGSISQAQMGSDAGNAPKQLQAPLVDWSHAQQVYRMAEGWLREGEAGKTLQGDAINVTGLTGVRVTLRWLGLRMGTGQASFDVSTPADGKVINLTEMTRNAVRGAMLQVNDKLRQASTRGLELPVSKDSDNTNGADTDATTQPAVARTIADLQGHLLMDIQIAGRLTPIRLPANAPAAALYHQFAPGYHGLRLSTRSTDGTPLASWLWPADSIAAGLSPHTQVLQLMSGLGLKIGQENTIARPTGPSLDSFEVIHMVRPGTNQPITRLTRGNLLLPPTSVDARTLEAMAGRIAQHLRTRQRNDGQFPGTYLPSSDRNISSEASQADGALACLALSRWANSGSLANNDPQVDQSNAAVRKWFEVNLPAMLKEDAEPSPAALALSLMTLTQNPALAGLRHERDQLAVKLMALRREDGSFHTAPASRQAPAPVPAQAAEPAAAGDTAAVVKDSPEVDVPVSALIADSLAAYYLATKSTQVAAALPATMTWVWDRTDPLRSMGALPWLLEADAQLETLTTRDGQNDLNPRGSRAARLARLLPTIEIIMSRQIIAEPAAGPADVIGGFELSEQDPATPPNPDWRTAHMLMIISQSLRNADLAVGRNRVEGILACGRAARFLGQLMFDEPGTFYVRNPANVIGGVRPVLWDNRLDLAPSAMTLLAACDLHKTLSQWAQSQQ